MLKTLVKLALTVVVTIFILGQVEALYSEATDQAYVKCRDQIGDTAEPGKLFQCTCEDPKVYTLGTLLSKDCSLLDTYRSPEHL